VEKIVVLAGPEYGMNVGMVCRVMKNFGVSELRVVAPRCELGFDAVKYSKHAVRILKKARIYPDLPSATKDCGAVVGFSGILKRHRGTIRAAIPLQKFVERSGEYGKGKVALVFGREGIGLTEGEIGECDFLVHIEADKKYPIMNLSHAVAVALYALSKKKAGKVREKRLPPKEKAALMEMFKRLVARYRLRNNERSVVAFRRIVGRANPTEKEGRAIMNVIRVALEELEGKKDENNGP
jgi:tRNA/rRNA methyltransferase